MPSSKCMVELRSIESSLSSNVLLALFPIVAPKMLALGCSVKQAALGASAAADVAKEARDLQRRLLLGELLLRLESPLTLGVVLDS